MVCVAIDGAYVDNARTKGVPRGRIIASALADQEESRLILEVIRFISAYDGDGNKLPPESDEVALALAILCGDQQAALLAADAVQEKYQRERRPAPVPPRKLLRKLPRCQKVTAGFPPCQGAATYHFDDGEGGSTALCEMHALELERCENQRWGGTEEQ